MKKPGLASPIPERQLIKKIYLLRDEKVMLDRDLAGLYGVETKRLNEAVRRNINRFPGDFMFELTNKEFESLRSQFATSKIRRGGTRYLPMAFTEQGVAMLSSVLKSEIAIQVNIQIIRIFTRMWQILLTHKDILLKLEQMEKKVDKHDEAILLVFQHLKKLLSPPQMPRQRIGFRRKGEE